MRVDAVVVDDRQLARLQGARFGHVVRRAQTTSTNSVLVEQAGQGAAEGLVLVADHQTAGRGRFDRRWEAPPGTSLLFSVLARPAEADLPAGRRHLVLAALSLAVVEASRAVAGVELALKWPNDVISLRGPLADRKVAGVLAEAVSASSPSVAPAIVVGAGVNVAWAPEGDAATSLEALARQPVDRGEVLVETLLALERLYGDWEVVSGRYQASCATVGREVTVRAAGGAPDIRGTALAVDEDGRLVVGAPDQVVRVAAGDVVHARMEPTPRVVQQ